MVVEFKLRKIPFSQQQSFPVVYKSVKVGEYVPDLITFESIILDTKVIPQISDIERAQVLNYLKLLRLR